MKNKKLGNICLLLALLISCDPEESAKTSSSGNPPTPSPKVFEVIFDLNYFGSSPYTIQNVQSGQKATKPPNPTRAGYSFAGWFKEKATTTRFDFASETITKNWTLYAKRAADFFSEFTHSGHTYYIIKKPQNWTAAAAYAKKHGGYLVHINNAAEQQKIAAELGKISGQLSAANSRAADGGRASYLWLGATDQKTEGTWVWDGDNDGRNTETLGQGNKTNWKTAAGAYQNWGRSGGKQSEPDDYLNNQDFGAIAFTSKWPVSGPTLGAQYQWNDVKGTNTLYSIVEIP